MGPAHHRTVDAPRRRRDPVPQHRQCRHLRRCAAPVRQGDDLGHNLPPRHHRHGRLPALEPRDAQHARHGYWRIWQHIPHRARACRAANARKRARNRSEEKGVSVACGQSA